jgi:protein-L-isoaspartate(D-aspartate) O-methyltransferase
MNTEIARFNMIEQQVRPWNVLDPAVLELLGTVRREEFVPPALRAIAFVDTRLPLTDEGTAGPCMLEPRVEARMVQALNLHKHEKVLEIGTGSGFMAALLAHRAMQVYSLECRPELARMARASLMRNGVANAAVLDVSPTEGARGLPGEAPFDAVVLAGAVAEVPAALLAQVKVGGRLLAVVGSAPCMQARLYTRTGQADWAEKTLFDTVLPPLEGFASPSAFHF